VNKIYDVGDWHLSDGTGPSQKNHDKMMRFCTDIVGDDDIYQGGDFFDLWRWSKKAILNGPNADIIEWHTKKENSWIEVGNHDLDLAFMREVFQKNVGMGFTVEGWLSIHGHQFDARLDHPEERKLVRAVSLAIQKIDFSLLNKFRDWVTSGVRSNAAYRNKMEGVKLIMHHTHVPEVSKFYMNPGSWTGDECMYLVREEDGVWYLRRMK
jgi:UDP-2,3-diacylglucosamine pyrophosphatase LpxH